MPYVNVLGTRLYYEVSGDGIPLLLCHHAMGAVRSFRKQIPFFSQYYQVIAYDRRGHGRSAGIEDFAEDYQERALAEMVKLLDTLGVESAHILGHSEGGTLGLMLAADYPSRARSLVTAGAHAFYEPAVSPALADMARQVESDSRYRDWAGRNLGPERALPHARRFAARWHSSFPSIDGLLERMRTIRCPSYHIYGTEDIYGTTAQARIMAEGTGGEAWIIPGAGHDLHQDLPDEFNRRVLEFLSGIDRQHRKGAEL